MLSHWCEGMYTYKRIFFALEKSSTVVYLRISGSKDELEFIRYTAKHALEDVTFLEPILSEADDTADKALASRFMEHRHILAMSLVTIEHLVGWGFDITSEAVSKSFETARASAFEMNHMVKEAERLRQPVRPIEAHEFSQEFVDAILDSDND